MKPLTKEKRAAIERELMARPLQSGMPWGWLREVLAAESYWRESVKNAIPAVYSEWDVYYPACPFCQAEAYCAGESMSEHEPECAWRLAQWD